MNIIETEIPGVIIFEPKVFTDERGYFFESYSKREFEAAVSKVDFVQDNQSKSICGVVRGLHFQRPPFAQAKLVRCIQGAVLDIAVDIRKGSPTYGRHVAIELSEDNHREVYIPQGFAHGYAVLTEETVFQYKCDNYYAPEAEGGLSMFDSTLNIYWPLKIGEAIISEKDRHYPDLINLDSPFNF